MSVSKQTKRVVGIDRLRGWLIFFVLLGHIVLGSVHDNLIRYGIYAFHMPVFIGLTGFLINAEALRQSSFIETMTRYWWRVLFPFAFAFVFFTAVLCLHAAEEGRFTSTLMLSFFHSPYYHLWFIPTLVLWVIAFSLLLKLRVSLPFALMLFLLVSILWAGVPKAEYSAIVASLLSKKVVYFFSFFLFGAWLRTSNSKKFRSIFNDFRVLPVTLIMACAGLYLVNIGVEKSLFRALVWIVLNLVLITFLIDLATTDKQAKPTYISEMGRHSLPIYLWHFVPLFILKGFDIHHSHPIVYYSLGITGVCVIVIAVLQLQGKNKLVDRCLYGTV